MTPYLAAAMFQEAVAQQVDSGDEEIIIIRETSELGPLLYALIGLGILTLLATSLYWWLTRPRNATQPPTQGETNG